MVREVEIVTDGAWRGNPDPGAWVGADDIADTLANRAIDELEQL